ncbi:hypothetical protein ABFT23_10800 [Nocardioides sp. C4-1]|uniref:hypothetical protein n=1 Tax=Nocardioides sp. C4-1 TaxID=3151851 RepID=UPI003265EFC4
MRRSGSRLLVVLLTGLVVGPVTVLLPGCSLVDDQRDGTERPGPADPAPSLVETREWAANDGLVSVVLRNTADRVLRRAQAEATVVTAGSVTTTVAGPCCTVADVPPGADYAFSFRLPTDVRVDDLQVGYRDVVWSTAGSDGSPRLAVQLDSVFANAVGAVVVADVTADGAPVDSAVVQAVVDDAEGDLVAIVSGTWSCFLPGRPRRIWMQLYATLPVGSTVRTVTAFARPTARAGGDANLQTSCDPAAARAQGASGPPG